MREAPATRKPPNRRRSFLPNRILHQNQPQLHLPNQKVLQRLRHGKLLHQFRLAKRIPRFSVMAVLLEIQLGINDGIHHTTRNLIVVSAPRSVNGSLPKSSQTVMNGYSVKIIALMSGREERCSSRDLQTDGRTGILGRTSWTSLPYAIY